MNRRDLLLAGALATGLTATGFETATAMARRQPRGDSPDGPVTLYFEFRVAPPSHGAALESLNSAAQQWQNARGFLSLALKQMSGDSTAVKNYPADYKGVLAEAYLDGLKAKSQPYFYSLFVRFDSYLNLMTAKISESFDNLILPHLHAIQMTEKGPIKSAEPMGVYRGIFQTVAAGDRDGIYTSSEEMTSFLRRPVEAPNKNTVTVANHVMVADQGYRDWEKKVLPLLKVAQQTFQPENDPNGMGKPGSKENTFYRKALSTEILRSAFPSGDLRAYLMHGVWESYWDHENSHLDPRFKAAAGPVGAHVEVGPVEPFYLTRVLVPQKG
ncbi:MAG: hypothetical protein ACWA5T_09700 [Parvularcula sp.]